ncbi:MAG: hypothetical protein HYU03_07785 [Thaumarchaeota archaeon]|nr:hypothetical protein [Nitrososphaerota archaeon]MCS4540574.1 hypothetical protein [Nitrososphaerota archaeon]
MVSPLAYELAPLVHLATLVITSLSGFYVYRQRTTAYRFAKNLLIIVYLLYAGVIGFEFVRDFSTNPADMHLYTFGGTTLVLADVVVLTAVAVSVYFRPTGLGYTGLLTELLSKGRHGLIFITFVYYILFVEFYLIFFTPYRIISIQTVFGAPVLITEFSTTYLILLVIVLVIFLVYPSTMLLLAARSAKDPSVRRALIILPLAWAGIGLDLLVFNGYLVTAGIDATAFGYLIASMIFGITAGVFRRASLLAGFFEPLPRGAPLPVEHPFTRALNIESGYLSGKKFLIEVDPSVAYEQTLKDFSVESLSDGFLVYVFTARGGPVYSSLSTILGVRLYVLTTRVSYPTPGEQPNEVAVPQNDQAIILDVIDKTVHANPEGKVTIIYDNLSDIILSAGFEETYKFLKQINEIINDPRVNSLFILTAGAHPAENVSLIRSLFPVHITYDGAGLRFTRKT